MQFIKLFNQSDKKRNWGNTWQVLWINLMVFVFFTGIASAGTTHLVSKSSERYEGNISSFGPSISSDGRFIAFDSYATNLVAGDTNNALDVFVHDRETGQTSRVSISSTGTEGNNDSSNPSISSDGRFVAFESYATNLVAGDTTLYVDIFVHDRQTGETSRASISSTGTEGNFYSISPSISSDGRFIAFESPATNLVDGSLDINNATDIYVHDRQTRLILPVSTVGNNHSYFPSISSDGRFVAFLSSATNLVAGDTNNTNDVFVYDMQTGQTNRVSISSTGTEGNYHSASPSISSDGRFVAFHSHATNLVTGDTNSSYDVFVHDRQIGQTSRVSINSTGIEGTDQSTYPSISSDGRFVAFESQATNFVAGDTNNTTDVFVHDRQTGQTSRVSINSAGIDGNDVSASPSISSDGRFVAFDSLATNLVAGGFNNFPDIFINDSLGLLCAGLNPTFIGSPDDDLISGTSMPDIIHGLDGNDVIYGLEGDDIICGGTGDDEIYGDEGNDKLYGEIGNDILDGGIGKNRITGGPGNDFLQGNIGYETLLGGTGSDEIFGGSGNDRIYCDDGDDIAYGDAGQDVMGGGNGIDTLYGMNGNDTIDGQAGDDTIFGGNGSDTLTGNIGTDICDGGLNIDTAATCETVVNVP